MRPERAADTATASRCSCNRRLCSRFTAYRATTRIIAPMKSETLPGQPFVAYRDRQLYVESASLAALATTHGTPLFVYSRASMLDALAAYQRGFAGRNVQICYAMKANSSLGVLQVFAEAGCGFDIVSGGELQRVLAATARS